VLGTIAYTDHYPVETFLRIASAGKRAHNGQAGRFFPVQKSVRESMVADYALALTLQSDRSC